MLIKSKSLLGEFSVPIENPGSSMTISWRDNGWKPYMTDAGYDTISIVLCHTTWDKNT